MVDHKRILADLSGLYDRDGQEFGEMEKGHHRHVQPKRFDIRGTYQKHVEAQRAQAS